MSDSKNLKEVFEASEVEGLIAGVLKFTNLYCSKFDIFKAAKEWADEDNCLIYASIRVDMDGQICIDFRYDENLNPDGKKPGSFMKDYIKPLFAKKLGSDYLTSYYVDRTTVVVK